MKKLKKAICVLFAATLFIGVFGETSFATDVENEELDHYVDAGCKTKGKTEGSYCKVCGQTIIEQREIPATGHQLLILPSFDQTETEPGKTEGCYYTVCGEALNEQEIIPAIGEPEIPEKDIFNSCKGSTISLSITCKESDEFTFDCKDGCRFEYRYKGYASITVGGWSKSSKSYEFLFENPGEHILSVNKNGSFLQKIMVIIREEHSRTNGEKIGDKVKFICPVCESTFEEEISDEHKLEETIEIEPTCAIDGLKRYKCSECDYSFTEKLGKSHEIKEEIEMFMGTSKKPLQRKKCTCVKCGYFYTEEMDHDYKIETVKKGTCTINGIAKVKCLICGNEYEEEIKAKGHSYSAWNVVRKPTISIYGEKRRYCHVCRKEEQKIISKLKTEVSISRSRISLKIGDSYRLKIKKKTTGDNVLLWKSSKNNVVSVNSSGKIVALREGTANITLKMKSGCKATCKVTVKPATKLNIAKKTLKVGQKLSLKVSGKKTKVKWSSSNKKVATVSWNGKVTAKNTGKATITAKVGVKKLKCNVTVK